MYSIFVAVGPIHVFFRWLPPAAALSALAEVTKNLRHATLHIAQKTFLKDALGCSRMYH